jgi:hypothetical protein
VAALRQRDEQVDLRAVADLREALALVLRSILLERRQRVGVDAAICDVDDRLVEGDFLVLEDDPLRRREEEVGIREHGAAPGYGRGIARRTS